MNLHNPHNGPGGSTVTGYNQYVPPVRPIQNAMTPVMTRPGKFIRILREDHSDVDTKEQIRMRRFVSNRIRFSE